VLLGLCYQNGWGVEMDAVEAAKWLHKAAEQGNASAQSNLGSCYSNGTGVQKDDVEAAKWYRKAADQGDATAQYNLGVSYYSGKGVEKDAVEAAKWYQKAADHGLADAQFNLGLCYARGDGVELSATEAARWIQKAANQRNAGAEYGIGACYYHGDGVAKDVVEAVKWYRKAADKGYPEAEYDLGQCYAKGSGVDKDSTQAAKWFRKAADQGNPGAQLRLGLCYEQGLGVQKDVVAAANWYEKSANQGNAIAQGSLAIRYILGSGVIKNETEGMAWLYVASANGFEPAAPLISSKERIYDAAVISAARQRATEIQAQLAAHNVPSFDASAPALISVLPSNIPKASGSGAFISADGLVLTAAHVVNGASRIQVVTATGTFPATVVKIDATNDVALLKCTGSYFTPLPIAPSKEARPGTTVFTLGFPNIQIQGFDPKLTKGEISSQTGIQDDPRQWQISVPVQPGNSGGPLCDENGNLIGIVEATLDPLKMAKVAGEIPQNVNYAVKSSYILPLLDDVQNLPTPLVGNGNAKFEDVVSNVQKSAVLILVY
jgi:TPR repeat protein